MSNSVVKIKVKTRVDHNVDSSRTTCESRHSQGDFQGNIARYEGNNDDPSGHKPRNLHLGVGVVTTISLGLDGVEGDSLGVEIGSGGDGPYGPRKEKAVKILTVFLLSMLLNIEQH